MPSFPSDTADLHHEVELIVALGRGGRAVAGLIFGCAVGIDLTRRDLQTVAKKPGRPWDMASIQGLGQLHLGAT